MFNVPVRRARRCCFGHDERPSLTQEGVSPLAPARCPGLWTRMARPGAPRNHIRRCYPTSYVPYDRMARPLLFIGSGSYSLKEDTVRTMARAAWTMTAAAALAAAPVAAQSSLFVGVGFGFGGAYDSGSLFMGTSFGLGYGHGSAYGIYSDTYDGWGLGYRGTRHHHVSRDYCWDSYWDSYWDPWSGWYGDCVAYGPYAHSSWRARSWRSRFWYGPSTTYVYWRDPYAAPWGPYWSYDPWASYWDGYWDGRRWDDWNGYYGGNVRTVYAAGGRRGVTVVRPSPLAGYGTTFKEDPRATSVRTATRRPATSAVVAPVAPAVRGGEPAATSPPQSRPAVNRMPPSATPTRAAAPEARPSDRARGADGAVAAPRSSGLTAPARTPSSERAAPRGERQPASDRTGVRTPSAPVREPATAGAPQSRPSERLSQREPAAREPAARTPTSGRTQSAAPSRERARPEASPSRAPATRPEPTTAPRSRAAEPAPRAEPRSQPRSEPRAAPRSEPRSQPRSEPRAAPRSEPRSQPRSEPSAAARSEPRAAPRSAPSAAPRSAPSSEPRSAPASGGATRRPRS